MNGINHIKQVMKDSPYMMRRISCLYNILHYNNAWKYNYHSNRIEFAGAFLKGTVFDIRGRDNRVFIGKKARLSNCKITIIGDHCSLIIGGGHTIVNGTSFWLQDDHSHISIGKDFICGEGSQIASCEGTIISLGDDCMLSEDIEMRSSDSHSIFNTNTRMRINEARNITISNHVWITAHVRILKGSYVAAHCVVGNSSLVSGKLSQSHSIYAGVPCKLMKEQIEWSKYKLAQMPEDIDGASTQENA
jgi:acetyltransferase-like isoleucine patch superfamily enzyme